MSKTATILAVRATDIPGAEAVAGAGVLPVPAGWSPDVWAGPRPTLENDPTFRQIIPYVVVTNGNQVLAYVRATSGGEGRLHNKASIGVGGHIDVADAQLHKDGSINLWETVDYAARRELGEELGINTTYSAIGRYPFGVRGLIVANRTEVDMVHLGVLMTWDAGNFLASGQRFDFEDNLEAAEFRTPLWLMEAEARAELDLESWSSVALSTF